MTSRCCVFLPPLVDSGEFVQKNKRERKVCQHWKKKPFPCALICFTMDTQLLLLLLLLV